MLKSMSTNKVKVRALQTEKGEMRYVFGPIGYVIRNKRLIALFRSWPAELRMVFSE